MEKTEKRAFIVETGGMTAERLEELFASGLRALTISRRGARIEEGGIRTQCEQALRHLHELTLPSGTDRGIHFTALPTPAPFNPPKPVETAFFPADPCLLLLTSFAF